MKALHVCSAPSSFRISENPKFEENTLKSCTGNVYAAFPPTILTETSGDEKRRETCEVEPRGAQTAGEEQRGTGAPHTDRPGRRQRAEPRQLEGVPLSRCNRHQRELFRPLLYLITSIPLTPLLPVTTMHFTN